MNLKGARIIVSGGVGVGSREGFALIEELARTVGGVVGASRAAVDAGWIAHDHQVGQTGTTVRPKLYIACGISGSVQHRAGMERAPGSSPSTPTRGADLQRRPLRHRRRPARGHPDADPGVQERRAGASVSKLLPRQRRPPADPSTASTSHAWSRLREDGYARGPRLRLRAQRLRGRAATATTRTLEIAGDIAGEYIEPARRGRRPRRQRARPRRSVLRPRHRRGPRAPPTGRPHGHDAAAPVRRPQPPRLGQRHGHRDGLAAPTPALMNIFGLQDIARPSTSSPTTR